MKPKLKLRIGLLAALSIGLSVGASLGIRVAFSERPVVPVQASYKTFDNLDELGRNADVVALVALTHVVSRQLDYGGDTVSKENGDTDAAVPVVIYSATVRDVLSDGAELPKTIQIVTLDPRAVVGDSGLQSGDEVLVALVEVTSEYAPSLNLSASTYSVVSGVDGVFDVDGEIVTPRGYALTRLKISDVAISSGKPTFTTTEIRAALSS